MKCADVRRWFTARFGTSQSLEEAGNRKAKEKKERKENERKQKKSGKGKGKKQKKRDGRKAETDDQNGPESTLVAVPETEEAQKKDSDLARFLSSTKAQYLADARAGAGDKWTIVMGNEAGDLDTLASAIAFAWLQSEVHGQRTVPLLQVEREDLVLRTENRYALERAGVHDPAAQLLTATDITPLRLLLAAPVPASDTDTVAPPQPLARSPLAHAIALVDHNRAAPAFAGLPVSAVVDHHADEGLYADSAAPRIVQPAGSCSSLVARLCFAGEKARAPPPPLASLLLSAILIDTSGLKPGGKALDVDREMAALLLGAGALSPTCTTSSSSAEPSGGGGGGLSTAAKADITALHSNPGIKELTRALAERKEDVGHLSAWDLLRRDYKEMDVRLQWAARREGESMGGEREEEAGDVPVAAIKVGLSSVPVGLAVWGTDGRLEAAAARWMALRGLGALGVLTSFRDTANPPVDDEQGEGSRDAKDDDSRSPQENVNEDGDERRKPTSTRHAKATTTHVREQAWVVVDSPRGVADVLWVGLEADDELRLRAFDVPGLWQPDGSSTSEQARLPSRTQTRVYRQGNTHATRKATAPLVRRVLEDGPRNAQ